MIKIEKINDFEKINNKPRIIRSYLLHYLNMFFDDYKCSALLEFGAFYRIKIRIRIL